MKLYELTYFISPNLTEKEAQDFSEKIINLVHEKKGVIAEIKGQKKIIFSYPIKKEGEGYLASLNFYFDSEELASLKSKIASEGQILRYFILTKEILKAPAGPQGFLKIKKIEAPVPTSTGANREILPKSSGRERIKKGKVELAEIEQKLEEILGK